jgi:antitoxin ParD1/3/4
MIRKTISMPDEMGSWITKRVTGEYNNESEYFRELVRRDQAQQDEILTLRKLIEEGEASGISDATVPDIIKRVKQELIDHGELPAE